MGVSLRSRRIKVLDVKWEDIMAAQSVSELNAVVTVEGKQ